MNTAPDPTSPWAMPAMYTARLIVDGKKYEQTFAVRMDPRVKTGLKDLTLQHDLSSICYSNIIRCMALKASEKKEFQKDADKYLNQFTSLQNILQESDMPPTTQTVNAVHEAMTAFEIVWGKWMEMKK